MLISTIPLYSCFMRDIAPFYASVALAFFGPWVLYFTYFEGTSGQTIGKRATDPDSLHHIQESLNRTKDELGSKTDSD